MGSNNYTVLLEALGSHEGVATFRTRAEATGNVAGLHHPRHLPDRCIGCTQLSRFGF